MCPRVGAEVLLVRISIRVRVRVRVGVRVRIRRVGAEVLLAGA